MKQVIFGFIVIIVALLPVWPYSHGWGYASSLWVCLLGFVILALHRLRAI
jgi:hypothetical protein